MPDPAFGAVVLAGGAGRRLGGADKPGLLVGGRTLLDTAIAACADCAEVVVVGPRRPTVRRVHWTVEDPPGSGPLAALAAGLTALPPSIRAVAVLASDLPSVTADATARLADTLRSTSADAVLMTGEDGSWQPLTAVYRRAALDAVLETVGDVRNQPLRAALAGLRVATLADPSAAEDIDTVDDLARWITDEDLRDVTRKENG